MRSVYAGSFTQSDIKAICDAGGLASPVCL